MYSTISLVREISGFSDTTKIPDTMVKNKITIADSMLKGALAFRYVLPIPYHYQNTITLTGTSTQTATMNVVVNGTTYAVSVTTGDTASTIADKIRIATKDSVDFITDDEGSGAQVLLISNSDDVDEAYSEVEITSVGTITGITSTIGTRAKRFPPIVTQLSADIASTLLIVQNYGNEAEDTGKDAQIRMRLVSTLLSQVSGQDTESAPITITDEVTEEEIPRITQTSSIPNTYTNNSTTNPTAPKISINSRF